MVSNSWLSIQIINSWGSGFITSSLLNLFSHQPDTDETYSYAKDPYELKCQLLINKGDVAGKTKFNASETFIEYSNNTDDIYKNIEKHNLNKNKKHWFYLMIWLPICLIIKI